ncbi:response regulator transcription factor [Candidatus Gottesmanbacteria bacterium]|nr:response regulator transcription factor [Candidatus Gottesmanbacteria bacterium]
MKILVIEDELKLSNNIKQGLNESGFAVDQAFDGEEGQYLAESEEYDVIILDLMLPKIDGVTLCKILRSKQIKTPIMMLTAKARLEDKIEGLDVGADDYLTKPFEFAELKSRINALLRRSHNQPEAVITIGELVIDPAAHTVKRNDRTITLTAKEFAILEFLARHKDEVVTRTQILEHTWDYNFDSMSNIVDVFIATLRKKIDEGTNKKLLHTVRGVGFKLSEKK